MINDEYDIARIYISYWQFTELFKYILNKELFLLPNYRTFIKDIKFDLYIENCAARLFIFIPEIFFKPQISHDWQLKSKLHWRTKKKYESSGIIVYALEEAFSKIVEIKLEG